ncbi:PKD domain-containing protein [Arthrobacter sp. M4]|nr:PKD domain-containing protein [Arthrobacter sp. M4]
MASNNVTKRYWYSDRSLGTPPPPPPPAAPIASFTASPTTGTAPLTVNFTDTSTGAPTSWSWTFGDGGTSAAQNPSHVYNNAGSYPVALAVTNSSGSSSSSGTITATAPSPGPTGSVSAVGSATVYSATATTALTLPAPAGITAGDLLIAAFTTDLNPTPTAPSGWTPIVNALSINSSSSSGARVSVYYHVVASGDPGSFTWTLSSAVKWGGGITAYRGVNQSSPLDATVTTSVDTTYSATSITLPGITTASNGAMLIGGLGFDAASPGTTPPSGWTEQWEAAGGQVAEEADVPQPTAGTSSSATWSFAVAKAVGAWRTALKPA